jgi:hypothetical protein
LRWVRVRSKYLLEFHGAQPTRETLKQSISTGKLELFKMMRERLPEAGLRDRLELMKVAAEFHQPEVLAWFVRDAKISEHELLAVSALERKQADTLLVAFENGLRPWWGCTRESSLQWRPSAKMEFVSAPEGFSAEGGWWRSETGEESALPPLESEGDGRWFRPEWVGEEGLAYAALPPGVTMIDSSAFQCCAGLTQVEFPSSLRTIGGGAFRWCTSFARVEFPSSLARIMGWAFYGCSALTELRIPANVTIIEALAFTSCSSLTQLELPSSVTTIEGSAFSGCSGLTQLQIPSSVTVIGTSAFANCSALTWLEFHRV